MRIIPSSEFNQKNVRMTDHPSLDILLANPRGFCAGVDRAIIIVEQALEKFGAPIYVRHEVVHNKFVVDELRAKGAIFVEELFNQRIAALVAIKVEHNWHIKHGIVSTIECLINLTRDLLSALILTIQL